MSMLKSWGELSQQAAKLDIKFETVLWNVQPKMSFAIVVTLRQRGPLKIWVQTLQTLVTRWLIRF